jgi:hypothetical protein
MYESAEYHLWRQRSEEILHEVATNRLERNLRANRETRPYVVRDLSWEFARLLDTHDFPAIALATPDGANGNSPQPK